MRVRHHIDGSIWIQRPDPKLEAELDKKYIRMKGSLRWFPPGYNQSLEIHRNAFKGKTCYILGKGPSLDKLKVEDFKIEGPIICVNDSIKKINSLKFWKFPVFVIQQDATLKEKCRPENPDGILILAKQSRAWYTDYKNRIIIEPAALGVQTAGPTVIVAISIAQILGCNKIIFISFDAVVNKNCNYANIIGYSATVAGKPERFLPHKNIIFKKLESTNLSFEFFTPEEVSDISQQQSKHLPKLDEIVLYAHSADLPNIED